MTPRPRALGGAMALALTLTACAPSVEEILQGGGSSVYPPDGAVAIRGELIVAMEVGDAALPEVTVRSKDRETGAGQRWEGDCTLIEEEALTTCFIMEDPPDGQDFTVEVLGDGLDLSRELSSRVPRPGVAWALHEDAEVLQVGRSEVLANVLRELLQATPMVAALDSWQGGAWTGDLVAGLATEEDGGGMSIDAPGLTLVLPVTLDATGALVSTPTEVWMPVSLNGEVLQLRIQDAVAEGVASADGLELTLEGALDGASLVRLIEAYGWEPERVLQLVRPDVDTDGDGANDALSLVLALHSPAVQLQTWVMTQP